jgi:hypothetical protein
MKKVKEKRICVKLCFRVGKTGAETHMLREACGNDGMRMILTVLKLNNFNG